MTSMEFYNHASKLSEEPPEWGTGTLKNTNPENLWLPKQPTWHHNGDPGEHHYRLTQLRLSDVRPNDQLLPNPQNAQMHKIIIDRPFPAEHPFASHQERKAVFPKFDSPEDYKRGVEARRQRPFNDEMPAMPYDIKIVSKIKGNCRRHELQALPPQSLKEPLVWPEHDFDQLVKQPGGGQQVYYPTAPKTFVPNLTARSDSQCLAGNMQVRPETANMLRNIERDQWMTTYDRNHTGLGPTNPMKLDNYEEKSHSRSIGINDQSVDQLKPKSVNTFDPPRPYEGRIARTLQSAPAAQTDRWPEPRRDTNYRRKKTLSELEEDRLLNGFVHRNYPEDSDDDDAEWRIQQRMAHPESTLALVEARRGSPDDVPYKRRYGPAPVSEWDARDQAMLDQHHQFQQMEAQNRYKELELQKPGHNLGARQHKVDIVVDKEQVKVFYDHEGKYQTERAGMYKTSYDPYKLQASMNKLEDSGGYKFDISESHKDALNYPFDINEQMHEALRHSRTLGGPPGSVPQLHSQPTPFEAFEPFNLAKSRQKARIQPGMNPTDVRTMERELISRESSMGEEYNTHKFLQEHDVAGNTRKEALALMSNDNQDLNTVRAHSTAARKGVTWSGKVQVATGGGDEPLRTSVSGEGSREEMFPALNPSGYYSAREPMQLHANRANMRDPFQLPVTMEKDRRKSKIDKRYGRFGVDDQFASRSTTFTGPTDMNCTLKSAYAELHPGSNLDMSYKQDTRFKWKSGSGTPRPQTTLLELQETFTKSDTRKNFHRQFFEINPDLRENIIAGKQHEFGGLNAQVLRGTPINAC